MSATDTREMDKASPAVPAQAPGRHLIWKRQWSLSPLARIVYWLLVGWWAAWLWTQIAWVANLTVIGAPASFWMLNRMPILLLLSAPGDQSDGTMRQPIKLERLNPQRHWLARTAYLVLVGWWLSWIWANIGWMLCATILGMPFGMLVLSYLPSMTTLLRAE